MTEARKKISLTSWMANLQINWFTARRGTPVGTDQFGNRYFKDDKRLLHGRERRWVLYNGEPEASKVPPEWHGWLHHNMAQPLSMTSDYHKPWIKPHTPNMTGTTGAYHPPGHPLAGGLRDKATGDYWAWTPELPE
jgi:NADH:ubiquinone oxidoreductase subunit